MSQSITPTSPQPKSKRSFARIVLAAIIIAIVAAMALDTKIVRIGSDADARQQAFSADAFGQEAFPRIQSFVTEKAVDAVILAPEALADKAAAAEKYGTASTTGAIMMVKFTGVAGTAKSGVYEMTVDGLPADIRLRLQTGPAINGTDLRDATGDIIFGDFKNQIEYQDAGAGINRAMKAVVLDGIDTANLSGKTIEVVGAFRMVNPKMWQVTPVSVVVK